MPSVLRLQIPFCALAIQLALVLRAAHGLAVDEIPHWPGNDIQLRIRFVSYDWVRPRLELSSANLHFHRTSPLLRFRLPALDGFGVAIGSIVNDTENSPSPTDSITGRSINRIHR